MSTQPECFVRLPGNVTVQWEARRQGGVFEYSGTAEDLIACGAVTADMLIMNPPKARGPRRKRRDADGDRYSRLPGGVEAVMATMRYRRWEEQREAAQEERGGQSVQSSQSVPSRKPARLKLVVDNTRALTS